MRPFTVLEAIAAPLPRINVDTDQIIPARFMRKPWSDGYGKYLFHDLRFRTDGSEESTFVLNQPAFRAAAILVAGENFGCGSSREPAVWALADFGIRAVVAPSFGDIFYSNCLKNGILPIRLRAEDVTMLSTVLAAAPTTLHVDLPEQRLSGGGHDLAFEIEPFRKAALVEGLDEISMTLKRDAESIASYVEAYRERAPWVFVRS